VKKPESTTVSRNSVREGERHIGVGNRSHLDGAKGWGRGFQVRQADERGSNQGKLEEDNWVPVVHRGCRRKKENVFE